MHEVASQANESVPCGATAGYHKAMQTNMVLMKCLCSWSRYTHHLSHLLFLDSFEFSPWSSYTPGILPLDALSLLPDNLLPSLMTLTSIKQSTRCSVTCQLKMRHDAFAPPNLCNPIASWQTLQQPLRHHATHTRTHKIEVHTHTHAQLRCAFSSTGLCWIDM